MGMVIAFVWPQSKSDRKGLAIGFPWIVEQAWKTVGHAEEFWTLTTQTDITWNLYEIISENHDIVAETGLYSV